MLQIHPKTFFFLALVIIGVYAVIQAIQYAVWKLQSREEDRMFAQESEARETRWSQVEAAKLNMIGQLGSAFLQAIFGNHGSGPQTPRYFVLENGENVAVASVQSVKYTFDENTGQVMQAVVRAEEDREYTLTGVYAQNLYRYYADARIDLSGSLQSSQPSGDLFSQLGQAITGGPAPSDVH